MPCRQAVSFGVRSDGRMACSAIVVRRNRPCCSAWLSSLRCCGRGWCEIGEDVDDQTARHLLRGGLPMPSATAHSRRDCRPGTNPDWWSGPILDRFAHSPPFPLILLDVPCYPWWVGLEVRIARRVGRRGRSRGLQVSRVGGIVTDELIQRRVVACAVLMPQQTASIHQMEQV